MALGDKYLVQFGYSVYGVSCSNTFYLRETTASPVVDKCADVGLAVNDAILDLMRNLQSDQVQSCFYKAWSIDADIPSEFNLYEDINGAIVGAPLPANKNIKVNLRQNLMSARTNGELRLAGIPEFDVDGNSYLGVETRPATIGSLTAALTSPISHGGPTSGIYELVIKTDGAEAQATGQPPIYNLCVGADVPALIYSDRRRTSKHQSVFNTP